MTLSSHRPSNRQTRTLSVCSIEQSQRWRIQQCLHAPQNWEEALYRKRRVWACGILHKLDRGVQICEFGETRERTMWSLEINNQKSYTRSLVALSHSISCVFLGRVRASTWTSRKEKLGICEYNLENPLPCCLDDLNLAKYTQFLSHKGFMIGSFMLVSEKIL